MAVIDVFNGDADGLCSLVQLRLAYPQKSQLVTGVKRHIQLLKQVDVQAGDRLCVFDISMKRNHADIQRLLAQGAVIFYVDHHQIGPPIRHNSLEILHSLAPYQCTSMLVDRYLGGQYRHWAIVGAFGDNLKQSACQMAQSLSLVTGELEQLQRLGLLLNYNGYGRNMSELHFHPGDLFKQLIESHHPLQLTAKAQASVALLDAAYQDDLSQARLQSPLYQNTQAQLFYFPNQAWAHRIYGLYGNELSYDDPNCAYALAIDQGNGQLTVSVRAPFNAPYGAAAVCSQFVGGGGREGAAGINSLPIAQLDTFWRIFSDSYQL